MYSVNYENDRNSKEAFLLVLKKYKQGNGKLDDLDRYYENVKAFMEKKIRKDSVIPNFEFTNEDFEKLLLGNHPSKYLSDVFKNNALDIAYDTIGIKGIDTLGTYAPIDENGNKGLVSSLWLCHILQAAEFASDLAVAKGLDSETAKKLGILHDIGRSKYHDLRHVTEGARILDEEGWNEEKCVCLSHSFLTSDVAAMNDPAPKGWSIDEKGNITWENGEKTDMATWLEDYSYNDYDLIVQLADVLVEQRGKVDIKARLEGIRKRREARGQNINNQPNRAYFLTKLHNAIISTMMSISLNEKGLSDYEIIDFSYEQDGVYKKRTVEEIEEILYGKDGEERKVKPLSDFFATFYDKNIKGKAKLKEKIHEEEER